MPDVQLRWFEIADWFENEQAAADEAGGVPGFLVKQFRGFLEARGMNLAQVGKYMPEGVRAMSNLLNMLVEAAHACHLSVVRSPGWDSIGLKLDNQKYWLGVTYAEPEKLWFGTRNRIDSDKIGPLGDGEQMTEEDWIPGRQRWWRGGELDSEAVHFFARSKVNQMEWLMGFLRECVAKARAIESPDQTVIPDEND